MPVEQDTAARDESELAPSVHPALIGEHYRVEAALGQGGMARVYRVVDLRDGTQLALKKLEAAEQHNTSLRMMFEREYHALAQLAHPRIVRVFDYALDGADPFYTMELLAGADARSVLQDRRPSVRECCQLLRDAASALALIHSRRMVHRDIGPRNLWCTPDGHAKLIDFGTLVAMGPQSRVAGTPPFVPPEAVYGQPIDARCDIYALGALAYFLLTKRNAYPARQLSALRQLWQHRPKRPDAINREVSAPLADLVMAMLSLDARARPSSAAEIFERLSALAELPPEDERHAAQAFLTSPKLVGRERESAVLRKHLMRAIRGRGGSSSVVAPAGLGRSRMLTSLVLEAKLIGAAAISADAIAAGAAPFALAGILAERLLESSPMTAALAMKDAGVLGLISPGLRRALGDPPLAELPAADRTRKLSRALLNLFEAACEKQRLLITVDDVHRADGASLAWLGRLALSAHERRLLLVTSCDVGALVHAPPVLEQLVNGRHRVELGLLPLAETHALLGSVFGEVAGLDEAAAWLHELTQGNPQACMQYAQYLVDHRIARYEGGQWKLPAQLRTLGLPETLGVMFDGRVTALSADARSLALGLALARDESRSLWQPENHILIEDYRKILDTEDSRRAFEALDELLRTGVLQQRDSRYVLGQRALVDALLRMTEPGARTSMHARLAAILEQPSYAGRLLAVRQLQQAGDQSRARELLTQHIAALASGNMDMGAMRVSLTADCARAALLDWQTHGGSLREGILLRRLLLLVGSVYDWSLARFGDEQIAQLRADSGLTHWESTDPTQQPLQRVIACLQHAQQEHDKLPAAERGLAPGDALRELAACAMPLSGALVHAHEIERLRALPAVLEPLRPLSPVIALLADGCQQALDRATGVELGDRMLTGAQRLMDASELPDVLRRGGAAVNVHIQCLEDARRGRPRAFEHMERIAAETGDDMFLVVHGRWLAHAFRGESSQAERQRKLAEVVTEDDVWRRKAYLFIEAQLHVLTGDLAGLGRVSEAIAELAQQFPGWLAWLSWARAAMHMLRGELEQAAIEVRTALTLAPAGAHRAWVQAAPLQAELLLALGDDDSALAKAEQVLAEVNARGLDKSAAVAAERIRALCESQLGEHEAASESIERASALARELGYEGLPLARLHEARARIALQAGDAPACVATLTALRALLEHADAPARVNAYEMLRVESSYKLAMPDLPAAPIATRSELTHSSTALFTEVRTRLHSVDEQDQRAQQALELLLEDSGARGGHLYLMRADGLFAAAALNQERPSEEFLALAQRHFDAEYTAGKTAAVTVADLASSTALHAPALTMTVTDGGAQLLPVMLADHGDGQTVLAGVAFLLVHDTTVHAPNPALLQAITRCLHAAGDSIAVAVE